MALTITVQDDPGESGDIEVAWDEENISMTIKVTGEGMIIDCYQDDQLLGTRGMTYDEWHEHITESTTP